MTFDVFDTDSVATAGITFSNGNLTALGGAGMTLSTPGMAQSREGKKAGKWYVEFTCVAVSGNGDGVGLIPAWGIPLTFIGGTLAGAHDQGWGYFTSNHVVHAASTQTSVNNTTWGAGDVIGMAIDLDNSLLWFNTNGGAWVGTSGTPNPATGTGGFSISGFNPALARVYPGVNLSGSAAQFTANFGASAFAGTVPSGFAAGWPNTTTGTYFGSFAIGGPRGAHALSVSAPPQNDKAVSSYTSTLTGTLTAIVFAFPGIANDQKAVIYDSTGAGGLPGALIAISTNTQTGGGTAGSEYPFTFSGVTVVSGTAYWVGLVSDAAVNSSQNVLYCPTATNGTAFNSGTYASPTNPFGASPSLQGSRYPALIFVTPTVATKKPSNRNTPMSVYRTSTGLIYRFKIYDSTKSDGSGLTGLVFNSSGLKCSYSADGATATAVTLVTATIGTWTSAGFKEIDSTNLPGWYEFGIPNAALSATGQRAQLMFWGATNMYQVDKDIDLVANNPQLANLPNVAAGANGGLPTGDGSGRVTVIANQDKAGYALTSDQHTAIQADAAAALAAPMTESYAAPGAAPSADQALLFLHQALGNTGKSGNLIDVYKLDGTTVAGVLTVDNAAAPATRRRTA